MFPWTAAVLCFALAAEAKCPAMLPLHIGDHCYKLQFDLMRFNDALDSCIKSGSSIASYGTREVLKKLEDMISDYILSKLENAVFWIGLKMADTSMSKATEDRDWTWDYDDSQFVQKDYRLWYREGGPTDKGLPCALINGAEDFAVRPVDCGGPNVPVICMRKEEVCKHDVMPYLAYGNYCLAALNAPLAYNKIHGACSTDSPTPYKEEMKEYVVRAAKNSFFGGGIYQNIRRSGKNFYELSDGSTPDPEMWEEGEPRGEYDCVGLSLQTDHTLKLKTVNCEFLAASLCSVKDGGSHFLCHS